MGGGGSKAKEEVTVISQPAPKQPAPVAAPKLPQQTVEAPNGSQSVQNSQRSAAPSQVPAQAQMQQVPAAQQQFSQQQAQSSPKKQPAQQPSQRQQDQYEKLAERARIQQQVEAKHNIQPAAPHMQQALPQQMAPLQLPPSTRASLGGNATAGDLQQMQQQQAPKERRKKENRQNINDNQIASSQQQQISPGNTQGGSNNVHASVNQSLNNSIITGSEKPQIGVLSRQATQAVPQIQFQVNVSTVEYKVKKQSTNVQNNYGYGGNNGIESPRGFNNNYGAAQMPMGNLIGMDNSNDRGDEINLDELHKYIGGGGGAGTRKF